MEKSKINNEENKKDNKLNIHPGEDQQSNEFWKEGSFAETVDAKESPEKMRTFHMKHDEEMNYKCRNCDAKISAHNKDWHAILCDKCFKETYFSNNDNSEDISGENENTAMDLADAYYNSVIDNYKHEINNKDKEDFGYNVFVDGIKTGLDLIMPLLDETTSLKVNEKIRVMCKVREKVDEEISLKKIKCSYCSIEIGCPEESLNAEKHLCGECFEKHMGEISEEDVYSGKIYTDASIDVISKFAAKNFIENVQGELFENVWEKRKSELEKLSKKELALTMFELGVFTGFEQGHLNEEDSEDNETENNEEIGRNADK